MTNLLQIDNYTLTIKEEKLKAILKNLAEQENPGFNVKSVTFNVQAGYSDQREYEPSRLVDVKIELVRASR